MRNGRKGQPGPYDVIVVGARVAGAATAMLLARRGLRVLMVDRRRPDADTLSTHALMRGGVMQLDRWGLLDRVRRSGAQPVTRTTFHYGDTVEPVAIRPSGGIEALFAPRRYVLDSILVEAAAEAGVEVRFGTAVRDLLMAGDGRVLGVEGRGESGNPFRAVAPITIGADGSRSLVARRVGAPLERHGVGAGAMIYSYWSGAIAGGYEWFYRPGVSAGLIPTNGGQTCVWVGVPQARFARLRSDLGGSFHRLLGQAAPEAAARLHAGRRQGPFYGFPGLPSYMRRPWGPGWALVGDASHFKDPLSTHGITDALRDAEFLAAAVIAVCAGSDESEALAGYAGIRDRLSTRLHEVTDEIARYRWNLDEVRALLLALSRAMKDEVAALASLDRRPLEAAA